MHGTSKSAQFWHRPSGSSPLTHLMLRRLQKSPSTRSVQDASTRDAGSDSEVCQAQIECGAGTFLENLGSRTYRPWRRAVAFAVFATFIRRLRPTPKSLLLIAKKAPARQSLLGNGERGGVLGLRGVDGSRYRLAGVGPKGGERAAERTLIGEFTLTSTDLLKTSVPL